jgi:hypothetical protein
MSFIIYKLEKQKFIFTGRTDRCAREVKRTISE